MTPRAINVAIVSPDRDTLRRLCWLLNAFGYRTSATVDVDTVVQSRTKGDPDVLLLDAATPRVDLKQASFLRRPGVPYLYTLLLCDPARSPEVADAVEWGIDDLLHKPVNNGEVLARLRAAARFLEFENRLQEQATRDGLTKLLAKGGLLAAMRRASERPGGPAGPHAIVCLDLDFFSRVNRQFGRKRGDETLCAVAAALTDAAGRNAHVARLEEDRFAVLAPSGTPQQAAELAGSLREKVAAVEVPGGDPPVRLTVSVVYSIFHPEEDVAVEALERATDALSHAKYSGRNLVIQVGQFDTAAAEWRKELNSGNPFASVIARDIMQPFSYLLQSGLDFDRVAPRLLASGLEYFPVVDKNRSLVGVIGRGQLPQCGSSPDDPPSTATGPPLVTPQTVAEEASFGEVVERFSAEDLPLLVVVRNKEPRGYITREGFLNLIEPIHTSSFRPTWPFSQGTDYLVVPEIVKLEEAGV